MLKDARIVGRKIKQFRRSKGWKQSELAEKVGVKVQQVALWEKGRSMPRLQRIPLVAKVLEVEPEVLFSTGEVRDGILEDTASNEMLKIVRKKEATDSHKLAAAKGLKPKRAPAPGSANARLAEITRQMEEADANLTRLLDEIEAEEEETPA